MSLKNVLETTVNPIIESARAKRIIHLETDDTMLSQNLLTTEHGILNNFGSCSYLGMEFDDRLINGSVDAIRRYGTQFSASRAYMSIALYRELEELMQRITGAEVLVTPTTTLGHLSVIPSIISSDDAVIMDHQVHNSVQMALKPVKLGKARVEILRHNRMDLLRERIEELSKTAEHVWYMADGIYSMYGDACPLDELYQMLEDYPKFHLYVDDAHGMSCFGDKGQGYVLSQRPIHRKMIVALSMAKAFASGGAVFAFGNAEWRDLSRNCGGPMITSGPIQPSVLGASIAMARIQLLPEYATLRDGLQHKIQFMNDLLELNRLPLIAKNDSPIFFVGTSKPQFAKNVINRMVKLGYFLNLGIYPAVPIKNTGIRFTVTRLHTKEAMREMVRRLAKVYYEELDKSGLSISDVWGAFKLQPKVVTTRAARPLNSYTCKVHSSITEVDEEQWNEVMAFNPLMTWGQLISAELASGKPENPGNWRLKFIVVRDAQDKICAATVACVSLCKDDMLASSEVSEQAELARSLNREHLTSKVVMTGLPYSSGSHIYLDTEIRDMNPLNLILDALDQIKRDEEASTVIIREFDDHAHKVMNHIADQGYFKSRMLPLYHVDNMNWDTSDEFVASLSARSRKHIRKDVISKYDSFEVRTITHLNQMELLMSYELFRNVHARSRRLNTFPLSFGLFDAMNKNAEWKCALLYLNVNGEKELVGTAWGYQRGELLDFPIIGIDYNYQDEFKVYQQLLFRSYEMGKEWGAERINWGYTSDVEKRKFNAQGIMQYCMVQTDDNYTQSLLMEMSEQRPIAV